MRSLNGQDRSRPDQKPQRSNVLTSSQRFSVRVALATGATLAALMGVQTLALQEQNLYAADTTSNVTNTNVTTEHLATTSNDQDEDNEQDNRDDQAAMVISNASPVIQVTAQPTATLQPTTAPVTINTTTSSQPRPRTRSSR